MKMLQALRETKGWSKAELARRACMSASTVGQLEKGRLLPYESQAQKLADALAYEGDHAALFVEVEGGD